MERLGKLEQVSVRGVWPDEARDFTPWLAQEENIKILAETVGMDLTIESVEQNVGIFYADIVCKNAMNGSPVLVENQLERTDHCHLGQVITYAAGLEAVTIIWIASKFTEEHRAAIDWLNERTEEDINFFGLEIEVWKIGDSKCAPKFNVVCQPNDWVKAVKHNTAGRTWDEESFMQALAEKKGDDAVAIARDLLAWARSWSDKIYWGNGAKSGSFIPAIKRSGSEYYPFAVWTYGTVENQLQWLAYRRPFDDEQVRRELLSRLNKIPGVSLPGDAISRRPGFKLEALMDPVSMKVFKDTYAWVVEQASSQT